MNYEYNNIDYYTQIDFTNKLPTTENTEVANNYFISDNKENPSYLNYYNIYNNRIPNNFNNNLVLENQNQNFFCQNKIEPKSMRSLIKEEIKNIDCNDEFYKNYNFIPKNFNYDNTKKFKLKNKNSNNINTNDYAKKNTLCDFLNNNKNNNRSIKILTLNQNQSQNRNKKDSYYDIYSSRNIFNNYYLTDNNENNSYNKYNISPLKNDSFPDIKAKKQIIYIKREKSYEYPKNNNNNKNKIESNIQKNDISSDKKMNKKDNHINKIPVPKNIKRLNNIFEKGKNLFNYTNQKEEKKENNVKMRNENFSAKKNLINIDINTDFDNHPSIYNLHKKNKSSSLFMIENLSPFSSPKKKNNCKDKMNNIQLIKKSLNTNNLLKNHNSEKIFKQKVKYKTNNTIDFLDNNELKEKEKEQDNNIFENVFIKKKVQKVKKLSLYKDIPIPISIPKNHNSESKLMENFNIIWGGKSQAGKNSKGNIKINQDAFKVCENVNNIKNFNIFILCDGHGNDGHYVSQFVTKHIITTISYHPIISSLKEPEDIYKLIIDNNYKIIKDIFSETDNYLSHQTQFDTNTSGTTCVLILQIGNKIICANSGDSRAILVYSPDNNSNNTQIFPLSLDSKPDLPSEEKRIINCGGEVHKRKNRKGNYVGPMRVFAKGKNYPGLAMSRSLGDFKSKEYGVINEPSFVEHILDEHCKYMVICSDGVWDFMDNEKVMKIGNKYYINDNPDGFCQEIVGNASYWWEKEEVVIDDITAIIVFFKF
jgi:serine/threonine protein phosphatase PrpC